MPDDVVKTEPMPAVPVAIIGTGTGGANPTPSGTIAVTPDHQANILVQVVSPVVALGVRFANTFFVTFLGLLTAAGIGQTTFHAGTNFGNVLMGAALSSLIVAGFGAIKDAVTIFSRLEAKYPLGTGAI